MRLLRRRQIIRKMERRGQAPPFPFSSTRTVESPQKTWRLRMLVFHLSLLLSPLLLLKTDLYEGTNRFGFCLFRWITGIDCPACGITRSVAALCSGDVSTAFHAHSIGPVVFCLMCLIVSYLTCTLLQNGRGLDWGNEVRIYSIVEKVMLFLFLASWAYKLVFA